MLKYLRTICRAGDVQRQFDWLCPEVRRETPRTATETVALLEKIIRNFIGKGLFFRNISEIFRIIRNFAASFNPLQENGKTGWAEE